MIIHALPSIVFDWSKIGNLFLESMELAEILDNAYNLECFDYMARCNYGLQHQPPMAVRSISVP
jgi:hypothetical protein